MSPLEIVAVAFSLAGVWLTAMRKPLCWPVGLVSVLLYAKVFFDAKLYSDLLLQGFFAGMILYGWHGWRKGALDAGGVVEVGRVSPRGWIAGFVAGAAGTVALGALMAHFTDAAVPWLDAGLTSFSLVSQYWTARRWIETWWLWIAVDVIYTGLFLSKELYLTAVLYALFVGLAVRGPFPSSSGREATLLSVSGS
jgi:nicotinamide mononucleotide transporter